VDGHPAYASVIADLKQSGDLANLKFFRKLIHCQIAIIAAGGGGAILGVPQ
jgi:hypothetical protein